MESRRDGLRAMKTVEYREFSPGLQHLHDGQPAVNAAGAKGYCSFPEIFIVSSVISGNSSPGLAYRGKAPVCLGQPWISRDSVYIACTYRRRGTPLRAGHTTGRHHLSPPSGS